MSFLEVLPAFLLVVGLLSYYHVNGYYAVETVAAPAPLCACSGACVVPEVLETSKALVPAAPATPAPAAPRPHPGALRLSSAASPSPLRTPKVWRNTFSTDQESVDSLLRWMNQRFMEGDDDDDDP